MVKRGGWLVAPLPAPPSNESTLGASMFIPNKQAMACDTCTLHLIRREGGRKGWCQDQFRRLLETARATQFMAAALQPDNTNIVIVFMSEAAVSCAFCRCVACLGSSPPRLNCGLCSHHSFPAPFLRNSGAR